MDIHNKILELANLISENIESGEYYYDDIEMSELKRKTERLMMYLELCSK